MAWMENERSWGANPNRPDLQGVILQGKRGRILTTIYRAGGAGAHPTVLLLHGIPGLEKNFDLAQGLRRAGFHVVTCHYSGSWNSDGAYAIAHCLEDSEAVLDFIRKDTAFGFAQDRVFLVGHSLGGFLAAQLAAKRQVFRALVTITPCDVGEAMLSGEAGRWQTHAIFTEAAPWLNGTTADSLFAEAAENAARYRLAALAEKLQLPIYCIGGTLDTECPPEQYAKPWADAVAKAGGNILYEAWETDHACSDMRLQLLKQTTDFLLAHLPQENT